MVDFKQLAAKYQTKVGYTLTAISLALFALTITKPKIDDPTASTEIRQLYGAGLVFLMVLLFGILKNFVWDDSWSKPADAAPPAAGAITEGKEPAALKEESGKTRKRTPKM